MRRRKSNPFGRRVAGSNLCGKILTICAACYLVTPAVAQNCDDWSETLKAEAPDASLRDGFGWAIVVMLVTVTFFSDWDVGLVIGAAVAINLVIAALAGVIVPIILRRMNIDPALAGGVVLTTVTDVVGFMSFLGLGALFLT